MELKEQQSITKSVHSHIIAFHPKVANLVSDASLAKNKPTAPPNVSNIGGDEISAALSAVDGLFLKTNVELQTISNSSRTEMPLEAMKKMVRMEAAQEQRHLDREYEKQQYQQHVKRLDFINAGSVTFLLAVLFFIIAWVVSLTLITHSTIPSQVRRVLLFIVPLLRCCTRLIINPIILIKRPRRKAPLHPSVLLMPPAQVL
jgi:hypothetical protein